MQENMSSFKKVKIFYPFEKVYGRINNKNKNNLIKNLIKLNNNCILHQYINMHTNQNNWKVEKVIFV